MSNTTVREFGVAKRMANNERKMAELRHYGRQSPTARACSRPDFPIESGIPIPPKRPLRPRFPFDEMCPTDPFVVPSKPVLMRAYQEARRRGLRIRTGRTIDGQHRVWLLGYEVQTTRPLVKYEPPPAF